MIQRDDAAQALALIAGLRNTLRQLPVAEMLTSDPPPVPWIVEPLLVRGGVTLLAGAPGMGKSMLSQTLACAVVTGQEFAGFTARSGRVLVIDAENGQGEVHRRLRSLDLPIGAADDLSYYEATGFDLRHDLDGITEAIDRHRPDLVVLDSFRGLWGGDEDASGETGPVVNQIRELARRFGVAILILHRTTKKGGSYRGSSAIGAAVELDFRLDRVADDPDRARRCLRCAKSRPAAEPADVWLRISAEAGRISLSRTDAPPASDGKATVRRQIGEEILEVLRSGPRSRVDIAQALGRDAKDQTVRRALTDLENAGSVARMDDGGYKLADGVSGVVPLRAQTPDTPIGTGDDEIAA